MHEAIACPRCGAAFECKVGNITQCQCQAVSLTAADRVRIAEQYEGCLCANCLKELRDSAGDEQG